MLKNVKKGDFFIFSRYPLQLLTLLFDIHSFWSIMYRKYIIRYYLYIIWRLNMGKKPLSEKQIKSIRKLVESKPLHSLLLNLSVDLMLRGSDLLNLKVSDVMNESGSVKKEV